MVSLGSATELIYYLAHTLQEVQSEGGEVFNSFSLCLTVEVVVHRGGSRLSQTRGPTPEFWVKTYYLARYYKKLHESESNCTEWGGGARP